MLGKLVRKAGPAPVEYLSRRFCCDKKFSPANLAGKVGILGVPFGKGLKNEGKHEVGLKAAPDLIRSAGFIKTLEAIGVEICDYGNIEYEQQCGLTLKNMHNLDHVAPCAKAVAHAVKCILGDGKSCLVLGGDHSIGIGSIHGHMEVADPKEVALVYVDAHPDANSNSTSPTGNIHGMVVSVLAKGLQASCGEASIEGMEWLTKRLVLSNLAYIGVRSVDKGEVKFLNDNKIVVFGMDDIDKLGMPGVIQSALEKVDPQGNKSIHVSFDVDAMDPLESPSTAVPARGGLTLREAICLGECLFKTKRVSVVDIVEVNTMIGGDTQKDFTLGAVNNVLKALYGYNRKGNGPKDEHDKIKGCD